MRTVFGYVAGLAICGLVVLMLYATTQGLLRIGADPKLAGLWALPVLVVGYFLTRAKA